MENNLQSYAWRFCYRSSALNPDGKPTDILHEFYIPALRLATTYDRMAGYFRSSSLAAASQGFTSFLEREGKMRMIVGSDLTEQDVVAILHGDEQKLSSALLIELEHPEQWEESVQNGVSLLSNMVASGQLEVRVAFRKHAVTSQPLTMDATDDGYVHEKWFVMGDGDGNHLYGSGSLNESRTALIMNAENIDIHCGWEGGTEQQRVKQAQTDFEALWNNQIPHMDVLTLPQAVRQRFIILAKYRSTAREIDGTVPKTNAEPSMEELLRFAVLRDAPKMPGGQFIGMYSAPAEPWPHQEIVSRRLIETWPYSYMLCDEVGLGKTIEAALAIRSLILSGLVKRVLIVAPASLTNQWHRELAQKAMLPFARTVASPQVKHDYIFPYEHMNVNRDLYSPNLNIISSGLLSRKERSVALEQTQKYDIALVDEAHYARRKDPKAGTQRSPEFGQLYTAILNILRHQTKSLWMATATPMQIDPVEVYDLLKLTNRVAAYQNDPSMTLMYFSIMGKMVGGEEVTADEWRFLGQSYRQIEATDPYLWEQLKSTCVDSKNRKVLENLPYTMQPPKKADQKYMPRPMFAASPLSRVMMRHTRQLLEIYRNKGELTSNLARRHVLPLEAVPFTDDERAFYDQLEDYCTELMRQIRQANEQSKQMMYFLLNFLQLRFASSLYAILKTLQRRLIRVKKTLRVEARVFESDSDLQEYLDQLKDNDATEMGEDDLNDITLDALLKNRSLPDLQWEEERLHIMLQHLEGMTEVPSKIQALLRILQGRCISGTERIQQTVLFTRFLDTLTNIRMYLKSRNPKMRVGLYSGQQAFYYDVHRGKDRTVTHEEIKRLFTAGEIDLLLCTDAAAEGLNLQTANLLINYDLGWNPMKIEQRIGRIDRIGQKYTDIDVLNMCYLGSAEEIVYGRLLSRLREANLIVGVQQISMLPVEPYEFRGLEDGSMTEEEVTERATERLKEQRKANASMEMSAEELYNMYHRMSSVMRNQTLPATLSDIWYTLTHSEYLTSCGAELNEEDELWSLPPSELLPSIHGTINRNMVSDKAEFLTWGNQNFDMLVETIVNKLPAENSCIRRIVVESYNGADLVGYAVATTQGIQLITSFAMLEQLQVDVNGVISDEDVSQNKAQLISIAESKFKLVKQAEKVEETNKSIAVLHYQMINSIAIGLLEDEDKNNGLTMFWTAIRSLQEHKSDVRNVTVSSNGFVGHEMELMFPVSINVDKMYVPVNKLLLWISLDLAMRAADGLKMKKADIKTEDVIRRLSVKKSCGYARYRDVVQF